MEMSVDLIILENSGKLTEFEMYSENFRILDAIFCDAIWNTQQALETTDRRQTTSYDYSGSIAMQVQHSPNKTTLHWLNRPNCVQC